MVFGNVTYWFLGWQSLYLVLCIVNPYLCSTYNTLNSSMKSFWNASMISSIMSVLMCSMAARALYESSDLFTPTALNVNIIQSFVGYLCSDLLLVLCNRNKWPGANASLVHHVIGIVATVHVGMGSAAHTLLMQMILAECSTPFVNQRYFFETMGMKASRLYAVNGGLMLVSWFVFRIVNMGVVCWRFLAARDDFIRSAAFNVDAITIGFLVMYGFQWVWFYKIIKGALKVYQKLNLSA